MSSSSTTAFAGFPREGLEFLEGLAADNSRDYFDAHRSTYEAALLQPAKDFVVTLGEELRVRVSPGLRADPGVNGSILRINATPASAPTSARTRTMSTSGSGRARGRAASGPACSSACGLGR